MGEELVVDVEIRWSFDVTGLDRGGRLFVLDRAAGLDRDDSRVGAGDGKRCLDPDKDVLDGVVAVQEQHVAERAGPCLVAVVTAGEVPELLMFGPEPARVARLRERSRRGQGSGATPQHFEVVVQIEDLLAAVHAPAMRRDHVAVNGHRDGLGAELDRDPLADVTDRHRVEALPNTDPRFRVDPGREARDRREPLRRQRPQRWFLELGKADHTIARARPAASDPPLLIRGVAFREVVVELRERAELRDRRQIAATVAADVALHAALLVRARNARLAEERFEPVMRAERDEPLVLQPVTALQDLRRCCLEVVVADTQRHATEPFERADMRISE